MTTPHIFLVDDDAFQLRLLSSQLAVLGLDQVDACTSGQQALTLLAAQPVGEQLIFLDLNMPGMDGVEFVRRLVDIPYSGALVLVSGEGERILDTVERLARAHRLNVLEHLNKPVQIEMLEALIEIWRDNVPKSADKVPNSYCAEEVRCAITDGELVQRCWPPGQLMGSCYLGSPENQPERPPQRHTPIRRTLGTYSVAPLVF